VAAVTIAGPQSCKLRVHGIIEALAGQGVSGERSQKFLDSINR
jgi:hypothetical protein